MQRGSRADAVAAAAAAVNEAAAAAAAAAASRGLPPNFNTLLAAAARSYLPNASAGPGEPGGPGPTPFEMYSLAAGQPGPQGGSMMHAAHAGGAGGEGGLRNPEDGIMSTPDDAMLIPNMHVGAQGLAGTGALEAGGNHGMQMRQGSLEMSAFPALDFLHQSHQQQQQQQGGHGVSAAAAAEAAAAMTANRAAGRDLGYAEFGDGAQQQQLTLGIMMSGVKRGADGQDVSTGAAAAAAAAAGHQGITLPGFPVDEEEIAALEASHAAAAAAAADAIAAATAEAPQDDVEEQAALEAAASAAANAAELQVMAQVDAARRYTWSGGEGMEGASEVGLVKASQVQMYTPRFAAYGNGSGDASAAAAASALLAEAHAQRQQQQQQHLGGGIHMGYGEAAHTSGSAATTTFEFDGPPRVLCLPSGMQITSPSQVTAMRDATNMAELAAATAAAMSADANTPSAAAAAAAAAAATGSAFQATSAAELFYMEARMSAPMPPQQQHQRQAMSPPPPFPYTSPAEFQLQSGPTSTLRATAAAAQAAMAAALAAATDSTLLAGCTQSPQDMQGIQTALYPEDSRTFNNQQYTVKPEAFSPGMGPLPVHSAPQSFARQASGNAASSFSMPSEGTATAAAALAGLANTTPGGLCRQMSSGTLLSFSPTNSHQDQQQQQQQMGLPVPQQEQLDTSAPHDQLHSPDPLWGTDAAVAQAASAAAASYLPTAGSDPLIGQASLRSSSPANRASPTATTSAAMLSTRSPTPGLASPGMVPTPGAAPMLGTGTGAGPGSGGDLSGSAQWARSQHAVGQVAGCGSSKPPLPPAAAQAAAAGGDGGGSPTQRGRGASADRLLSPAGSGTSRLPAAATLNPV